MKKLLVMLAILAISTSSSMAVSKVAVVDVNAVVTNSSQVKALKAEQQQKMKELETWLKTVKADVEKQKTKEGKEKLVKKYDADFAKKQQVIKDNYKKKLQEIDTNITRKIETQAKLKGYTVVLSKNSVLYGGDDITADIINAVK